ncbi:MAG: hypothetical protein IKV00_01760 [Clostridia bacterium]|nr:hypothetical protein [Clostridia bacterium]
MTLQLTATTTEEKVLKEYLEQNASEVLVDKINNGVPVEKDGKKLISKKTLTGFMKYATDEARKQAEKGATSACLHSDIVFGWAIHYFEEDSILGTLYNEDGTEYKPPKPALKVTSKKTAPTASDAPTVPAPKPQPKAGQMSMFDLFDEPETAAEPTTDTDEYDDEEVALDTAVEAPESPVEDEEPEVEPMPAEVVTEPEKPVISPLWTRYQGYQQEHPEAVIAMRIGDFYEIFGESAETVSKPLELTVVSRDFGLPERMPMVGFPYHKADTYTEKLRGFTDVVVIENEAEKRVLPKYQPVEGLAVDTTTGEVIESDEDPDPYADTELMYKIYLLLDQKVEIVK